MSTYPRPLLTALAVLTLAVATSGLASCSSSEDDTDTNASDVADMTPEVIPSTPGEAVYLLTREDGNVYACATCHALEEPAIDGIRRVGHPIGGAADRGSWKNGQVGSFREAVDSCLVEWMSAEPFGSDTHPDFEALQGHVAMFGTSTAPISYTVAAPPADLTGGSIAAGEALFAETCVACHGAGGTGTGLAPPLAGTGVDAEYVARRTRTSGSMTSPIYPGLTGGGMPFWSVERLSDAELLDIVAYVVDIGAQPMMADMDMMQVDTTDIDMDTNLDINSGCTSTHPKVGQTATLTERFHDVGGTATIHDDCTIVVTNFTYDGTGIDVRFYAGTGGDYDPPVGFALSDDLIRAGGYAGETMVLTLPMGRSMDDLDGLSVWCVDIPVSFGDGMFQ